MGTGLGGSSLLRCCVMKTLRRGVLVAILAAAIAVVVRLRGTGGVAPTQGGWRELEGPDFR